MLHNNIELDLKTKLIESGTTQTEVAEKVGVSLAYVNRITRCRARIFDSTVGSRRSRPTNLGFVALRDHRFESCCDHQSRAEPQGSARCLFFQLEKCVRKTAPATNTLNLPDGRREKRCWIF